MPLSLSLLSRLQYQQQTLRELTEGLSEETLRIRPDPAKWSSFEQIAHLTSYQPVFIQRLARMKQEEAPQFSRYVADEDPLFHACLQWPLNDLLADIDKKRSFLLGELQGMSDEILLRTGIHPKYGLFPIRQWTEFFLLHEAHHLFAIFLLIQEQRKRLS